MNWKGALAGGIIGYLLGLFFKSLILTMITFKLPTLDRYLTDTFVPASDVDSIRFFTIPLPFALLGASIGVLLLRSNRGAASERAAAAATSTSEQD